MTKSKNKDIFISYAKTVYGQEEIDAVVKCLNESTQMGKYSKKFEKKIAKLFDKKHCLYVNSGSSALYIGIEAFNFKKNSEVITPALTFSTSVGCLVKNNLIPVFIDVEKNTFNINPDKIEEMVTDKTVAILAPNLLGNICRWEEIKLIADKYDLKIIEDSADTLGYSYKTSLDDWSDVSTCSFYASHVVTGAGFGGIVSFKNLDDFNFAKSLRSWGRRSSKYDESEDFNRRFDCKVDGIDYDDKYVFDDIGYNFIPSEISAAFALVQINKLKINIENRKENFKYLKKCLEGSKNFKTFTNSKNSSSGWLAFPILLQNALKEKRKDFQIYLEKSGIQTRTIFTGNILKQPVSEKFKWESFGCFDSSDEIMKNGVLLGCHNQMTKEKMDYMIEKIFEAENCLK